MDTQIIKTKLNIPQIHPNLVSRLRLSDQIEAGVQGGNKLTLVAAPAGFGKTTAVSTWVHQKNRKVAWLSLEESDNEAALFLIYLLASIRTIWPDFAEDAFAALTDSPPAPVSTLIPTIVNELTELDGTLVLILDDYHVITSQEIHETISFLLEHQPHQVHLVIATRADPPLPISRLRAQRLLTELRTADLRFTSDEARALLNDMMGLELENEDVKMLETRTEGWGVGLLLAAQSMQGRIDKSEFISAFSGSQHYILEYLIEEVLNRQSREARSFFLQTSILNRFCAPLCDAVTEEENSEETIQKLRKNNLFIIPLDQDHIWYRYHHLFADLLVNFLHKEFSKNEVLQLHCRASYWYRDVKNFEEAIKYALSGQDFEQAANLIEQIVDQVIARGQVKTLLGWIGAIPDEVINSRPRLLMHQGWVVFLTGRVTLASEILQRAKNALNAAPDEEERKLLHGRLSAMLATIIALTRDIPGAMAEAREALTYLPDDAYIYQARATRALGVCHMFQGKLEKALDHLEKAKSLALEGQNKFLAAEILSQMGTVRKHQGDLPLAFDTYKQILDLYDRPEAAPPACLGFIGLADIVLEQNDLQAAEEYLDLGIELCQKGSIGYALQPAYLIGGLLKCAQGDQAGALETIKKGEALSRMGGGSLESILGLAWFHTRFYLNCGDLEKAKGWALGKLLPSGWSFDELPLVLDEMHQSLLARVYLRNDEFEKVFEVYDRVCPKAEAGNRISRVVELSLFKAVALWELGQKDEAISLFEECLLHAERDGIVRLFLETGETVVQLLQRVKSKGGRTEYIGKLESAFNDQQFEVKDDAPIIPPQEGLIEPLTKRELQVLRLMCEGQSNQEIADEMIVSVNTVKKHTSNIYGKLGVRNRAQAVLRAREIELV